MVREAQIGLQQEFQFESALEDLARPKPSSVDLQNGLDSLSKIGILSPQQSRRVLDLASSNINSWAEVSETHLLLDLVTPSFTVYGDYVNRQENPALKDEYAELSSTILAGIYCNADQVEQDELGEIILKGKFGDSHAIFAKILSIQVANIDKLSDVRSSGDAAYNLWLDLLDRVIKDPSLKQSFKKLTERVMELDQYWQGDNVTYTCVESLDRLEMGIGEEEQFVEKYSNRIARTLRANLANESEELSGFVGEEGLSQDQQKRVARFLRELRLNEIDSKQELHRHITDNLLATVL